MRSPVPVILGGALLLAVLAPVTQFLTVAAVNASAETAVPVAWAIGPVAALAAAAAVWLRLARRQLVSPQALVLLFAMLAVGVPLLNVGLVRSLGLGMAAASREYVYFGTNTYRTAYEALDPAWIPHVPTREGLAWGETDVVLRGLRDEPAVAARASAFRAAAARLEREAAGEGTGPADAAAVAGLGADEVQQLRDLGWPEGFLVSSGWEPLLAARAEEAAAASRAARDELLRRLPGVGEDAVSFLPRTLAGLSEIRLRSFEDSRARLDPAADAALAARVAALEGEAGELGALLAALRAEDRRSLQRDLAALRLAEVDALGEEAFRARANAFLLRLNRGDREALTGFPAAGAPNQNLVAFREGWFADVADARRRDEQGLAANLREVVLGLPWSLWAGPFLRWGLLVGAIFLFLMAMAEWLRRKWVERENLAFPLVDLVEQLVRTRPASPLESTAGSQRAGRGPTVVFLAGFAVGFAILAVEALGHYEFLPVRFMLKVNFSQDLFTTGILRDIPTTVFVLSPIVVGILYLVSLELSLSIWACSFLYAAIALALKVSAGEVLVDGTFTGFGDGKNFPFPAEQLLGATMAYGIVVLAGSWKACFRPASDVVAAPYVHRRLVWPMLLVLPALVLALLHDLGIRDAALLVAFAVPVFLHAVADARARAETGLPGYAAGYDTTKLPMITGLAASAGARPFAAFLSVVFLPLTLLFRTLPQQLENLELARRFRVPYRQLAAATLVAAVVAVTAGFASFLVGTYYVGETWAGGEPLPAHAEVSSTGLAATPFWVAHFLGEEGLTSWDEPNALRLGTVVVGAGVVFLLVALRRRFFSFPLNPLGYVLVLLSIQLAWTTRTMTGPDMVKEGSVLWGSALFAWAVKQLVVKYGGIERYRATRPFFIGLAVGAVCCVLAFNAVDVVASVVAANEANPSAFLQRFVRNVPFSPAVY